MTLPRLWGLAAFIALAGLGLTAGCGGGDNASESGTTTMATGSAVTLTATSVATMATTTVPVTTASTAASPDASTPASTTATTAAGAPAPPLDVDEEGPCFLLSAEEIRQATGVTVDDADEVRGGCIWSQGTTPVVNYEVEPPTSSDAMTMLEGKKLIEGDSGKNPGIGEASFVSALNGKVWWVQTSLLYGVWVQTVGAGKPSDTAAKGDIAVQLARTVATRVGT